MTQQADTENKNLHDWFINFIKYFRTEYDRLSEEEKKFMSKWMHYLVPCQIEVFWLGEPELQLIVKTRFTDIKDVKITINGPYSSHEFFDNVDVIINQSRWQRIIERDEFHKMMFGDETYAEHLAHDLNRLVYHAKNYMFDSNPHKGHSESNTMAEYDYVQTFSGNIADRDYVEEVNSLFENVRRQLAYNKEHPLPPPESTHRKRPVPQGYGTYFFPPIILGEMPKFSPSEILRGHTVPFTIFESKVFDTQFNSIPIIVNKDGFIYVAISSKEIVLKILNTIMAVGVLNDLKLYAVREHELAEAGYDKQSMKITGYTYSTETLRLRVFEERLKERTHREYKRMEISEDTIKSIIITAADIFHNEKLVEELRLLVEAYTHLYDAEYGQSFVMSWIILERHISQLWRKWLDEKNLSNRRTRKLLGLARRSVDNLLEILNLAGEISTKQYNDYMEMKTKRNDFIHDAVQIAKEDAERCLNIAKGIMVNTLNL